MVMRSCPKLGRPLCCASGAHCSAQGIVLAGDDDSRTGAGCGRRDIPGGLTAPEAWLDHGAEPAPLALEAAERILSDSGAYPPELRREAQFLRIHGALVEHRPLPAWAVVGPSGAKERAEASPEAPITTSHLKALLDRFGSRSPPCHRRRHPRDGTD